MSAEESVITHRATQSPSVDVTETTPTSPTPPPLQQTGVIMGINISSLECIFVLMEFIFGTAILTAVCRGGLQFIVPKIYSSQSTCDFIYTYFGTISITYWLISRLGWSLQSDFNHVFSYIMTSFTTNVMYIMQVGRGNTTDIVKMPKNEHILLKNVKIKKSPNSKGLRIFALIIGVNLISVLFMLCLQAYTGVQIYSLDNFMVSDTALARARLQKDKSAFEVDFDVIPALNLTVNANTTDIENTTIAITPNVIDTTTTLTEQVDNASTNIPSNAIVSDAIIASNNTNSTTITSLNTTTNSTSQIPLEEPSIAPEDVFEFSWLKVLQLVLMAPLAEEIIFRCVMLTFVHLRISKYFPHRIELSESIEKVTKQNGEKKKRKIIIRKKTAKVGDVDDVDDVDGTDELQSAENDVFTSKIKMPTVNVAQISTVVSAVAFGGIHCINILNGHSKTYVMIQAIMGTLIGIVLNVSSYNNGHFAPFILHVLNNLSASLVSSKINMMDKKYYNILIIGYIETIICYAIFAYYSLKSLNNANEKDLCENDIAYYTESQQNALKKNNITIPRHYDAFNNLLIRIACYENALPCK